MIDPKSAAKLIRQHFEELTTEQFVENLHHACPEVFEEQKQRRESQYKAKPESDKSRNPSTGSSKK